MSVKTFEERMAEAEFFVTSASAKTPHMANVTGTAAYCGSTPHHTVANPHDVGPVCKTCIRLVKALVHADEIAAIPLITSPPTEVKEDMPAKQTEASPVDVDGVISDVHATIDQIAAIVPGLGAAGEANELYAEAEEKIRTLPTAKQTALRKEAKAARDKVIKTPVAPEAPKPAAVVQVAEDFNDIDGVPELVKLGADKAREGVEFGIKMGSVSEAVAHVILGVALRVIDPDTGLPDLMKNRKTTKNASSAIYKLARKNVAEDDVQRIAAHNALVKSVQNRNSDVLVSWLRELDTDSVDAEAFAKLFPAAAQAVENAKQAGEALVPSEAVRDLYKRAGVELPRKGRTELERERSQVKRLETKRKALEAAKDEGDADAVKALEAEVTELAKVLPADAAPVVEKTAQERAFERIEKATVLLTDATKGADKLTNDEKADLKVKLNAAVAILAAEAAKL